MGRFRLLACFATILLLGAAWFGYKGSAAQESVPTWSLVSQVLPDTDNFYSVYMQDVNTAWVAGATSSVDRPNPGRVYQISFDGIAWVVDASYSFRAAVRAVVAISMDNVWAVGDGSL